MAETNHVALANFIWQNAEDLWGDFRHTDFGKIILPFTLLRRLECVLEPTRDAVRKAHEEHKGSGLNLELFLTTASGHAFYNLSAFSLDSLGATKTRQNLEEYVSRFSDNARVIFEQFDFTNTILKMDRQGVLYKICQNFAAIDLHPTVVPDRMMSNVYEHLIRRFGAEVNEGAEDFMTPRDVVRLATALVLHPDDQLFEQNPGLVRTVYDPTCGTGGFLSDAIEYVSELGSKYKVPPTLVPYGQELEPETHAVCVAGMLLRTLPNEPSRDLSQNIALGSTLKSDEHHDQRFHYGLSNPPFGKKWEKDSKEVKQEHEEKGFAGRFGPGLPRISDGSMLFLMHLVSKLERPEEGGGRAAIVLSGSPLFNGGAGSGESEIRRWLLEHDYVDAIVALPTEIFFRTGIGTYLWILANNKPAARKGKVQLINATGMWTSIKNEGNKRRKISDEHMDEILRWYDHYQESETCKVMDHEEFGYRRIKVLRPLKMELKISEEGLRALKGERQFQRLSEVQQQVWMEALKGYMGQTKPFEWAKRIRIELPSQQGEIAATPTPFTKALQSAFGVRNDELEPLTDARGNALADPDLTDYENVPLTENIQDYFAREVLPHVPDAWIDESFVDDRDGALGRVGYEINFNRYFYKYEPPRPLEEIDAELKQVEKDIEDLLAEVTE